MKGFKMKTLTYYEITNNIFDGSFTGSWSKTNISTDYTDEEEIRELFKRAINEDWQDSLSSYNRDSVDLTLWKCTVPIDEDGDADFNEQDAEVIDSVTIDIAVNL
jgi:hypothetical protein